MALKVHTNVAKGLKLEVRKFFWLIPKFVKVTVEWVLSFSEWQFSLYWLFCTLVNSCSEGCYKGKTE